MKSVQLSQIKLQVMERGVGGLPLLLVHGFPLDHTMWQAQIDAFSPHCRVIAPDLRGFGRSDITRGEASMERFADDLLELLDALHVEQPVVFCGLSMGGYIAWEFFRKYPERVLALVLCDTRTVADSPEAAAARLQLIERVRVEGPRAVADAMIPRLFAPATLASRPELVEATRQTILQTDPNGLIAALHGLRTRRDSAPLLPTIDIPTLLVVGEHDAISPVEEMRAIGEKILDSGWVMIPDAGHLSPLENPAVFNDALTEFLTKW